MGAEKQQVRTRLVGGLDHLFRCRLVGSMVGCCCGWGPGDGVDSDYKVELGRSRSELKKGGHLNCRARIGRSGSTAVGAQMVAW